MANTNTLDDETRQSSPPKSSIDPDKTYQTGTYPIFSTGARELAMKLLAIDNSEEAETRAAEAIAYENVFSSWTDEVKPSQQERSKKISEFITWFGKTHEFLANQRHKSMRVKKQEINQEIRHDTKRVFWG